ncbi:uncharacterized protein LOC131650263 [Vicia villosa]|uniref:uncharacterized protein LOC131650263 n=1 Tax=Vicia villosa TaxID=3911 RepID=UPI00273CEABE|nr:uncharacterized protein LOC131650263 [Vicia villosa]
MVAKELYSDQEVGNEESNLLQDQYDYHYDNDDDETLSLRDLPNSTTSPQWGDFSKEDGKNSISNYNKDHDDDDDDDDNLFEFFSEEFTTSTTHDNIIFCGKLIPFKDHPNVVDQKAKLTSKSMKSSDVDDIASLKVKSFAYDYTSMGRKVSLVRSATKSRWFLFLFGMSSSSRSSSKEMKLSDIRNRLSRREPTAMFPVAPGNGKEVVKSKRNGNCKGVWKMLRSISMVLGCSSSKIANDVVKTAFV